MYSNKEVSFDQLKPVEKLIVRATGFTWAWHLQFSTHQLPGMIKLATKALKK